MDADAEVDEVEEGRKSEQQEDENAAMGMPVVDADRSSFEGEAVAAV